MTTKLKLSANNKEILIGLEFQIVYRSNGNVVIERIRRHDWQTAKNECENKGEFVSCTYIETSTDLLYLH